MKPVEKAQPIEPPDSPEERIAPVSSRTVRRFLVGGAIVFAVLFAIGFLPRLWRRSALDDAAKRQRERLPVVATATSRRAPELAELSLPGTMQGIEETGIYARTDGYLRERYVDIGDQVKGGQLLAEIEAPEVDQQLNQGVAALAEARANLVRLDADLDLAKTTLARYVAAGAGAGVSKQQIDERTSAVTTASRAVDAAQATVDANEANVARLRELKSFERVVAPFDGIITARNVDPGALISSGSSAGAVRELFRLARTDVLRIFVYAPQTWAPLIKVDQAAEVTVREFPKQRFDGTVVRTASALDPASRTMLTEVHIPNPDHVLLAGMYATVHFKVDRPEPPLVIPASALLITAEGVRVAVIDAQDTIHYRPVELGRDYGTEVEVIAGLGIDETIVTSLTGSLYAEGAPVKRRPPPPKDAAGAAPVPGTAPAPTVSGTPR